MKDWFCLPKVVCLLLTFDAIRLLKTTKLLKKKIIQCYKSHLSPKLATWQFDNSRQIHINSLSARSTFKILNPSSIIMQSPGRALISSALGKRFYARCKNDKTCPPCEPKKPPKLPQTARQVLQKQCHPCAYQWEEKQFCEQAPPAKKVMGNCKIPPCPPDSQISVNQCAKKKGKECPTGDWSSPDRPRKDWSWLMKYIHFIFIYSIHWE